MASVNGTTISGWVKGASLSSLIRRPAHPCVRLINGYQLFFSDLTESRIGYETIRMPDANQVEVGLADLLLRCSRPNA